MTAGVCSNLMDASLVWKEDKAGDKYKKTGGKRNKPLKRNTKNTNTMKLN